MEIKNKLYPYPVLADFSHEYKETSSFEVKADLKPDGYRMVVSFTAVLINGGLKNLVNEGKAEIILHLECGQTGFRHLLKFDRNGSDISWTIPNELVSGMVQICPFIMTACDIAGYSNSEFEDDLSGMAFDLPAGSILAAGKQINVQVTKRADDLRDVKSIFNIAMNGDEKQQYMQVDCERGDCILVLLPAKDWQKFGRLESSGRLTGVFSAMIAVPALTYVLERLRRSGAQERIDMSEKPTIWFNCISRTLLETFKIDITDKDFDNRDDMFELAQKMINGPLDKALDELMGD